VLHQVGTLAVDGRYAHIFLRICWPDVFAVDQSVKRWIGQPRPLPGSPLFTAVVWRQWAYFTEFTEATNDVAADGISEHTHSLTAALDQLRVVASSTSNDPGPRSRQHQQIGQRLLPLAAANFSVDDPAGASSQQREECRCGLLLTVEVPAKQVCSPVGDRCVQIMNDVCQQ